MEFGQFTISEDCVVYKSEHCFVFVNIRPFLPYHLLLSPIKKYVRMLDMPDEVAADLMNTLRKTMRCVARLGEACSVILQDGEAAGQTVSHVHFHVTPRKQGDLLRNNDIYLRKNLEIRRSNRTLEERQEETAFLKKIFAEENLMQSSPHDSLVSPVQSLNLDTS